MERGTEVEISMKNMIKRQQIFGDTAKMGADADVIKELEELDAEEADAAAEEKEEADNELFQEEMRKRKNKKLMKI